MGLLDFFVSRDRARSNPKRRRGKLNVKPKRRGKSGVKRAAKRRASPAQKKAGKKAALRRQLGSLGKAKTWATFVKRARKEGYTTHQAWTLWAKVKPAAAPSVPKPAKRKTKKRRKGRWVSYAAPKKSRARRFAGPVQEVAFTHAGTQFRRFAGPGRTIHIERTGGGPWVYITAAQFNEWKAKWEATNARPAPTRSVSANAVPMGGAGSSSGPYYHAGPSAKRRTGGVRGKGGKFVKKIDPGLYGGGGNTWTSGDWDGASRYGRDLVGPTAPRGLPSAGAPRAAKVVTIPAGPAGASVASDFDGVRRDVERSASRRRKGTRAKIHRIGNVRSNTTYVVKHGGHTYRMHVSKTGTRRFTKNGKASSRKVWNTTRAAHARKHWNRSGQLAYGDTVLNRVLGVKMKVRKKHYKN